MMYITMKRLIKQYYSNQCYRCGETKDISLFEPQGNRCIKCRNVYAKEYAEANKEKVSAYHNEYYKANKEKIDAYTKEYGKANKEQVSDRNKKYYKANREKILARIKANNQK